MNLESLKAQKESVKTAMQNAFTEMLKTASDEDIKKYHNLNEMVKELDAQIEMAENKGVVPAPKAVELSESQKWTKKFLEAVSTGGNFSGGMPREMAADVTRKLQEIAKLRQYCRVFSVGADYAITVESGLPTVAYVTEAGTLGSTGPTSTAVVLNAYKLGCIVPISREVVKDVTVDVVSWVTDTLARSFAGKEDQEILFGTGSAAVTGIENTTGITKTTSATTLVITWAEVKAALSAIGAYRQNATFVMGQAIADQILEFKDGSGNYIFPQNQELKTIYGHPVVISNAMPALASGKAMLFVGDFNYYAIAEREAIDVQILNELYAGTDQVGVKAIERLDGKVLQAGAFCEVVSK